MLAVFGLLMCDALRPPSPRRVYPMVTAAIAIVLLMIVHATNASRRLLWTISEPAFAHVVATLPPPDRPAQNRPSVPSLIGVYNIDYAEADAGGYLFYDAQGGNLADLGAGFACLPGGIPADSSGYVFRHSTAPGTRSSGTPERSATEAPTNPG